MYDFSVNYNSVDKFDILNIHKYLITKNNINLNLTTKWLTFLLNFVSELYVMDLALLSLEKWQCV